MIFLELFSLPLLVRKGRMALVYTDFSYRRMEHHSDHMIIHSS